MAKTIAINKNDYLIYMQKTEHAFDTMPWALENKKWTAAGREAVFTCICMSDALLAKFKNIRNISKNHMDLVKIFSTNIPIRDAKNQSLRLKKVLQLKNLVDYENKDFSEKLAHDICLNAKRFYEWGTEYI